MIRDPLNDDYNESILPDLDSDNEVKSEKDSEKSYSKLLNTQKYFKIPEELKIMRKKKKKQERKRIIEQLEEYEIL